MQYFGSSADPIPKPSFADVFDAVQNSQSAYGVVPVENSSNGSVVQLLDLLADRDGKYSNITVCAEHYLTVHHCLLVRKAKERTVNGHIKNEEVRLEDIVKLYTHPQAWGQCDTFLEHHFTGVERQDVSSTSKAAQLVAEDESGTSAAIASRLAGEFSDLRVLHENIEDKGDNTTRFLIIEKTPGSDSRNRIGARTETRNDTRGHEVWKWKSLISFTIDHERAGALADALSVFKKHQFNLTSIDTRPSRVQPWHYIFFVECGNETDGNHQESIQALITDLGHVALSYRHLGYWQDQLRCNG